MKEVTMRRSQRWDDASTVVKVLIMVLTAVQVSLAVSAWTDLAQRPADQVNGAKRRWAAIIAINFIGPMLYFARGRVASGRPRDPVTPCT
jgi:type IV secretory pathway VirB2 component (pilin)